MASLDEDIIAGNVTEEQIVARMLEEIQKESDAERARLNPPPTPQQPRQKIIVQIPKDDDGKDDPKNATVTRVKVLANGDFETVEPTRRPTAADRALVARGKKEVLSGADDDSESGKRPWWHYLLFGLGGLAGVGGVYLGYRVIKGDPDDVVDVEDEEIVEVEDDDVDDDDEGDDEEE